MVVSLVIHCNGLTHAHVMIINIMQHIITPATNAQSITAMTVVTKMMTMMTRKRRRRKKKLFFDIAIIAKGTTVLSVCGLRSA